MQIHPLYQPRYKIKSPCPQAPCLHLPSTMSSSAAIWLGQCHTPAGARHMWFWLTWYDAPQRSNQWKMTGRIGCEGTATKSCCRSSVHFLAYRYMIRWNLHKYKVFQGPSQVQLTSSPLGSADRVRTVSRPNMPTRAACHAFRRFCEQVS